MYHEQPYEELKKQRDGLKKAIESGQDVPGAKVALKAIEDEMATRKVRIYSTVDGQFAREHGRWRTAEECKKLQQDEGYQDYDSEGKKYRFHIEEVP